MVPSAIGTALAFVPDIAKAGLGLMQRKAGKKIQVGKRKVSDRLKRFAADRATRATTGKFAGQAALEEKVEQSAAANIKRAQEVAGPNEYLETLARTGGQLQDTQLEIGQIAAEDKARREAEAEEAQLKLGEEETRIREEEIAEQKAMKTGLLESGTQNIMSGVTGLMGLGTKLLGGGTGGDTGEGTDIVDDAAGDQVTGAPDPEDPSFKALMDFLKKNPNYFKNLSGAI